MVHMSGSVCDKVSVGVIKLSSPLTVIPWLLPSSLISNSETLQVFRDVMVKLIPFHKESSLGLVTWFPHQA